MTDGRVPHLLDDDAAPGDASGSLRAALRGARADVPDAARVEALSRSIAGAIGGGGGGDDGGGDGGGGGGGGGGAAVGGGAAIGATKLALGGMAVVAAIGVAVLATQGGGAPAEVKADAEAKANASAETRGESGTGTGTGTFGGDTGAETVLDVHSLPAAATVDAARPTATASAREVGSPTEEMALLKEAQVALAGSPGDALAKCDEHAKTYPHGALAEEREVIAVDALIRLGRKSEAEARADRFRRAHPGSAYVRRLDTLLGRTD